MNLEKLKEFVDVDESHLGETIEELIHFLDDYKELDTDFELNEDLIDEIENELEKWLRYYEENYIIEDEVFKPIEFFKIRKLKRKVT